MNGPFAPERIEGAAAGMGDFGPATRAVTAAGRVPPDLLTGLTLLLLAKQPRTPRDNTDSDEPNADEPNSDEPNADEPNADEPNADEKASPIAGGVWVRERYTVHRPLDRNDRFTVTGANTGRHVHKGRRYGTTTSTTIDSAGRLVATNVTTGLLAYEAVDGLADGVEGVPVAETPVPGPDHEAATANPHVDALRAATPGTTLGGSPVVVSLAMMAARDTSSPDNPIHSDLEAARAAGLDRPIAGGSHVLAFAFEPILAELGPEVLFHGAHVDTTWKAPTKADQTIVPTATVTAVDDDLITLDLEVVLDHNGRQAMIGTVQIPVPNPAGSHDLPGRE